MDSGVYTINNLAAQYPHHLLLPPQIDEWLRARDVDPMIRRRTRLYYDFIAHMQPFVNEKRMLEDLPPPLRRAVAMHLNDKMLGDMELLHNTTDHR